MPGCWTPTWPGRRTSLCDMFFHSRFDDADVETERGVILEEIGMYEDNPEDLCAERLAGAVFKGSPWPGPSWDKGHPGQDGRGVGCGRASAPTTGPTASWWPWRGGFTDADAAELAGRFAGLEARPHTSCEAAAYVPRVVVVKKKAIEQNHLTLAFPGLSLRRPPAVPAQLLSSILGGAACPPACSSRCGSRRGFATPSTPTAPAMTIPATSASIPPWGGRPRTGAGHHFGRDPGADRARRHQAELDRAREQSKANVLMGLESTQSHMNDLGRGELLRARCWTRTPSSAPTTR